MNRNEIAIYGGLVAAMAFGFVLGIEYTGRLAIQTYIGPKPDWLATVQTVRWGGIAAFAALAGGSAWLYEPRR